MDEALNWFREGGVFMYPITALGLLSWVLGLVTVLLGATRNHAVVFAAIPTAAAGVLAFAVGAIGYYTGAAQLEEALRMAAPEHQAQMAAVGERMALIPAYFSLGLCTIPALIGVGGTLFGLSLREDSNLVDPE